MAHDPVRLERIAREEMEGGGADQGQVQHQARERPGDVVGLGHGGELHRHRRAEEQQRPRAGAIRAHPPHRPAGDEIDRGDDQQERVEERVDGRARDGRGNRGKREPDLLSVALPDPVLVGHAGAQPVAAFAQPVEIGDAVDLEDAVAGTGPAIGRGRRQRLDQGPAAEPRVAEGRTQVVRGDPQTGDRQEDREQRPDHRPERGPAPHAQGGGGIHAAPGTPRMLRGMRGACQKAPVAGYGWARRRRASPVIRSRSRPDP